MASKYQGMTKEQMDRAIKAEQEAFEATTWSDGFLVADLRKAFEKVQMENWKDPVDAVVSMVMLNEWEKEGVTLEAIEAGITFFQGSVAKVKGMQNLCAVHITSPGYIC